MRQEYNDRPVFHRPRNYAGSISVANYCKPNKHKTLPPAIERRAFQKMRQGSLRARALLAQRNMPFVFYLIQRYQSRTATYRLAYADRVGVGMVALMVAIDTFDHTRGFKFISYAHRVISNAWYEAERQYHYGPYISRGSVANTLYKKIEKAKSHVPNNLIREFAAELGIPEFTVMWLVGFRKGFLPMGTRDKVGWKEAQTPAEAFDRIHVQEVLDLVAKGTKDPRVPAILWRYHVNGETLKEIGRSYSRTEERIRQIKDDAHQYIRTKLDRNLHLSFGISKY